MGIADQRKPTREEIEGRAYEIYWERGGRNGTDVEDLAGGRTLGVERGRTRKERFLAALGMTAEGPPRDGYGLN